MQYRCLALLSNRAAKALSILIRVVHRQAKKTYLLILRDIFSSSILKPDERWPLQRLLGGVWWPSLSTFCDEVRCLELKSVDPGAACGGVSLGCDWCDELAGNLAC